MVVGHCSTDRYAALGQPLEGFLDGDLKKFAIIDTLIQDRFSSHSHSNGAAHSTLLNHRALLPSYRLESAIR